MEPINNLIGPIDGFHFKHGGNEFSIHKVLLYVYVPEEWQYAGQKAHNPLTPNQLGTRGPSNVMSGAKGTLERSFFANSFKYASTTAIASSRDIHASVESASSIAVRMESNA
jgi:hypothetical protein